MNGAWLPSGRLSAITLLAASLTATAAGDADIVGLRLGITEQEAIAALRAHDPSVRIRTVVHALPNAEGARATVMLFAGVYGNERAGTGDEAIKVEFTSPAPVPRVLGIWRRQTFPQGHELTRDNAAAALRDKYGAPLDMVTTTGQTRWVWATGTAGKPFPGLTPCSGRILYLANGPLISYVAENVEEPRESYLAPDCGIVTTAVIIDAGGLVSSIGMALVDTAASVRTRLELEAMAKRSDNRAAGAERRGKPKL